MQKVAYWIISFAEVMPVINSRKKSKSHTICISWMKVVVGTDRLVSVSQKDTNFLNMVALLDSIFLNWSNCTLEKPPWPTKTSNTMLLPKKKTVKPKPGVSLNIMKPTLSMNKDRSGNKKQARCYKRKWFMVAPVHVHLIHRKDWTGCVCYYPFLGTTFKHCPIRNIICCI